MTMPHLGNCPHKPGTWCLPCVREEWERREAEADALRAKLSAAEARIGRLREECIAWRAAARDANCPDFYTFVGHRKGIGECVFESDRHNDLDTNAAQPQKD